MNETRTAGDGAAVLDRDMESRILVAEDDADARALLATLLDSRGYRVDVVKDGTAAIQKVTNEFYDVVLLDLYMPGKTGLEILAHAAGQETDAEFIVMTGDDTVSTAVEAMRLGAFDYVTKPLQTDRLLVSLDRALEKTRLQREVAHARRQRGSELRTKFIGQSPAIERMFDLIERVAPMSATVLITGETGTGKELSARAIHELSSRRDRRFVPVQCSALSPTLLESELFGHVKGSFTGAVSNRRGLFEEAAGGTLFLDEIATIPSEMQVKILRVLQERSVQRVGSSESAPINFRLIGATNVDLGQQVASGRFREDLYYRLNVFPIRVPPLRERRGDVPLLAAHFRERFARENSLTPPKIAPETMNRMMEYDWPGNVRELENFIERALIMYSGEDTIRFDPPEAVRESTEQRTIERAGDEGWELERLEREYILSVLERTGGHHGRAADMLGIARRTLHRKLKKYREEGLLLSRE